MSFSLYHQTPPRQNGGAFSGSPAASVLNTDEVAKWFDAIWTGSAFGGTPKQQSLVAWSTWTSYISALERLWVPSYQTVSAAMYAVLFPPLPAWLATLCSLCRLIAVMIIAPILLVALLDLAEYAVIRTLGLQRRKVRVKPATNASSPRLLFSPAQLRINETGNPTQAPLLSTGAYDAETLLRHRARSLSTASAEAIEEWQRTGGSFARVAEVRQAASSAASSPGTSTTPSGNRQGGSYFDTTPKSSPTATRSQVGAQVAGGREGLNGTEAGSEDDAFRSGSSSPTTDINGEQQPRRRKMRRSEFDFTPMEEKTSFQWRKDTFGETREG